MRYVVFCILVVGSYVMFAVQSVNGKLDTYNAGLRYSSGAPAGKTGAPGEGVLSCTECHAGSVNDGATQNILTVYDEGIEVTGYIPGEIYTVSLVLTDENVKEGFQATVLDNSYNEKENSKTLYNYCFVPGSVPAKLLPKRDFGS